MNEGEDMNEAERDKKALNEKRKAARDKEAQKIAEIAQTIKKLGGVSLVISEDESGYTDRHFYSVRFEITKDY